MADQSSRSRLDNKRFQTSRRGQSEKLQEIRASYTISDGVVTPLDTLGLPSRKYLPLERPGLLFDLAAVKDGDEQAALGYVHQWGSLGFSYLGGVDLGFLGASARRAIGVDPLWFIWGHASTIRNTLRMWNALQTAETGAGLRRVVADVPVKVPAWVESYISKYETDPESWLQNRFVFQMLWWMEGVDPKHGYTLGIGSNRSLTREVALQFIASTISGNLHGVHPAIDLVSDEGDQADTVPIERLKYIYEWQALVQVAYLHLADLVNRDRPIVQCQECGQFFEQNDRRQKFCPRSDADREEEKAGTRARAQSKCGSRYRTREDRRNRYIAG